MEFSKKDTSMIKGIAIIMMFFHHNFLYMSRFEKYTIISWPFQDITINSVARFSKICVALFVFLSVYGMTIGYKNKFENYIADKKEYGNIIIKRYFSMMFGYWFIFIGVQIVALFYDHERQIKIYGTGINAGIHFLLDFLGLTDLLQLDAFIHTWWYMGLAIVLVLLLPLLLRIYNVIGFYIIPLAFLLPRILQLDQSNLTRYLFTATIGLWCADQNILVRVKKIKVHKNEKINFVAKMIIELIILILLYKIRKSDIGNEYLELMDGLGAFFIVIFSYEFIAVIKWLKEILAFLGKHSMNMFLTHTLFRALWFDKEIYAFKYVGLIMLALIVVTVILSMMIEYLKSLMHYKELEERVIHNIQLIVK